VAGGTLGGKDSHVEMVVGGGHAYGGIRDLAHEGNIWRGQGLGDIPAEEGEENTHMEVAMSGGPVWRDQGDRL